MSNFPCPSCKHQVTHTIDVRFGAKPMPHYRRRRICRACDARFTTKELVIDLRKLEEFIEAAQIMANWSPLILSQSDD
jgi:transcriptional regulator NrdR family protein